MRKLLIKRYKGNPIILPDAQNDWESSQTFNPGAILLDNKIHLLYRAIGRDSISRLGYASSTDGFSIDERYPEPVYEDKTEFPSRKAIYYYPSSGGSLRGAEDPRIVYIAEDDTLYMSYTSYLSDSGLGVSLTSISKKDFLTKNWKGWRKPTLISKQDEAHKNWIIFPEKIDGKYAILHSIKPEILITLRDSLDFREGEYIESRCWGWVGRRKSWEWWRKGAGPPPIKTEKGWLLFYHGIQEDRYKIGAMLLELKSPEKILWVSETPILEPEEIYENSGFKPGVVYTCGAVVKEQTLLLYYGAADNYVCVASCNLLEFLEAITL